MTPQQSRRRRRGFVLLMGQSVLLADGTWLLLEHTSTQAPQRPAVNQFASKALAERVRRSFGLPTRRAIAVVAL